MESAHYETVTHPTQQSQYDVVNTKRTMIMSWSKSFKRKEAKLHNERYVRQQEEDKADEMAFYYRSDQDAKYKAFQKMNGRINARRMAVVR